ncbi:MAG: endonuclease domain-containing protein [Flavisolibacter sp.]
MKRKMFAGADQLLFQRARALRSQQTFAEELLWNYLRTKPCGFKFRRQHPFSNYILDFYCHALRLAIEVDGSIHMQEEVKNNYEQRQKQLEEQGLVFLRFTNSEIKLHLEKVIQQIEIYLRSKIELQ